MKREIIFSVNDNNKLQNLLEYLEQRWSTRDRDNFILKLDKSINIIQIIAESFPKSDIIKI